jgi:urease accessory protein
MTSLEIRPTIIIITTPMSSDPRALVRLLSWLSPAFPVGGFAYSHGLEAAVEHQLVNSAQALSEWLEGVICFGSARGDAVILAVAHQAVAHPAGAVGDDAVGGGGGLREVADLARLLFGAPELAAESLVQGNAFWRTVKAAWPHPEFDRLGAELPDGQIAYPIAVAVAAAVYGIGQADATVGFLHSVAANGISAAIRLGVIGQTDGQRIIRALEPVVLKTAETVECSSLEDIGSASLAVDMMALRHETQTTRLFRS